MEIPARRYERPTIKQILDFAHGAPTTEKLAGFAFSFGYLRRLVVSRRERRFTSAQLSPGGLTGNDVGAEWNEPTMEWKGELEDIDLWKREHADMKSFEEAFAWLSAPADMRSGDVPIVPIRLQEGDFSGEAIIDYGDVDPVEVLTLHDETETYKVADLRKQLARVVAAKLSENPPDVRYVVHDGVLKEFRVCTLLHYIWLQFQRLLSGKVEARRCIVCGVWEQKGDGYTRNKWLNHFTCGSRRRKREERSQHKKEDLEWRERSTKKTTSEHNGERRPAK
jgi:hypothetical protein